MDLINQLNSQWIIAGICSVLSIGTIIYYTRTILSGKIKPHMFIWLIWGVVTAVVAATQITSKGGSGSRHGCLLSDPSPSTRT